MKYTMKIEQREGTKPCLFRNMAIVQRKNELARGDTTLGTERYEAQGCYNCDGQNKNCGTAMFIAAPVTS